jgi:hypothetical protein
MVRGSTISVRGEKRFLGTLCGCLGTVRRSVSDAVVVDRRDRIANDSAEKLSFGKSGRSVRDLQIANGATDLGEIVVQNLLVSSAVRVLPMLVSYVPLPGESTYQTTCATNVWFPCILVSPVLAFSKRS